MKNILLKAVKKEPLFVLEVFLVVFLLFINFATLSSRHWATLHYLVGDGATFILTATAHNFGLGVPYKDYWEYRPPGYFLLIDLWVKAFSASVLSFKLFEALPHFLVGIQICFLVRKFFSPIQTLVVSALTLAVFFSPIFGHLLFPESRGVFFSLMGLLSLLYIKRLGLRFFLASFFFSTATQLKDTFLGGTLTLVPALFFVLLSSPKLFIKGLFFTLLGYLLPVVVSLIYLVNLGAVDAYFEVFRLKSGLRSINPWSLSWLEQYYKFFWDSKKQLTVFSDQKLLVLLIFPILVFVYKLGQRSSLLFNWKEYCLVLKISQVKSWFNLQVMRIITLLFYALGSFLGPSVQGNLELHYMTATIIPTYLFWAILALFLESYLSSIFKFLPKNLLFLILILIVLFPRLWIASEYRFTPKNVFAQVFQNLSYSEDDLSVEKFIKEKTRPNDCILSIYGGRSEMYLYTERKPCTRFLLPNIVITEWQMKEYRQSIINHPPQVIIYTQQGSEMNHSEFEQKVINIPNVLKYCYKQDFTYTHSNTSFGYDFQLYFPIFSGEQLKQCISENS